MRKLSESRQLRYLAVYPQQPQPPPLNIDQPIEILKTYDKVCTLQYECEIAMFAFYRVCDERL